MGYRSKVSILLATYNQEHFIAETLDSILNQNYSDYEIVIGDDCSTDSTVDIIEGYIEKYPNRIKLIKQEVNLGITKNCNVILSHCDGEFVALMAGDDLMLPNKICTQVEYLINNPLCSICYHDLVVFNNNKTPSYLYSNKYKPREGGIKEMIRYGTFFGSCSVMLRRKYIPNDGYNESIPRCSDWLFCIESLGNGTIDYISTPLGKYRRHENNITNKNDYLNELDHLNSCNILLIRYPELYPVIINRYSDLLLGMRRKKNFHIYILASLKLSMSKKNLGALLVYIITLGKVKI